MLLEFVGGKALHLSELNGFFTIMFDFTWSVSYCEKFVGGYSLWVVCLVKISQYRNLKN